MNHRKELNKFYTSFTGWLDDGMSRFNPWGFIEGNTVSLNLQSYMLSLKARFNDRIAVRSLLEQDFNSVNLDMSSVVENRSRADLSRILNHIRDRSL